MALPLAVNILDSCCLCRSCRCRLSVSVAHFRLQASTVKLGVGGLEQMQAGQLGFCRLHPSFSEQPSTEVTQNWHKMVRLGGSGLRRAGQALHKCMYVCIYIYICRNKTCIKSLLVMIVTGTITFQHSQLGDDFRLLPLLWLLGLRGIEGVKAVGAIGLVMSVMSLRVESGGGLGL